jgi:hypothetical protein
MIGKHQNLPTDKLVLIAESGFRRQARDAAEAAGVATFAPDDLDADDPSLQVVNQLRSLWPKLFRSSLKALGSGSISQVGKRARSPHFRTYDRSCPTAWRLALCTRPSVHTATPTSRAQ